ncbi:hypothetical protein [uncultured Pseudokineococcus sp.]|uniref:hypothetical protein n=1 Tax=uncultured Pseudokineococcus sp. TaxID=1642928 RepID=UPI00260C68B7|nr:hypothetical protein [uncultured Pseudokineococcus sp.]
MRPSRRRPLLLGAAAAAALALGAAVVVSGLPGDPPVLAPVTGPVVPGAVAGSAGASPDLAGTAPTDTTTSTGTGALSDVPVVRDPFTGSGTPVAEAPVVDPGVTEAVVPGAAAAGDAGTAAPTAVAAGLRVTWTEVREGGWYVFTVVDGTQGSTVAATAGSALGVEAPTSDVVFAGPSTVVDASGGVVDSVSVRTSTTALQLVLGETVVLP